MGLHASCLQITYNMEIGSGKADYISIKPLTSSFSYKFDVTSIIPYSIRKYHLVVTFRNTQS